MLIQGQGFNISQVTSHCAPQLNSIQTTLTTNVSILENISFDNTCVYMPFEQSQVPRDQRDLSYQGAASAATSPLIQFIKEEHCLAKETSFTVFSNQGKLV